MAKHNLSDLLRAGMLASGWTVTQTRAGEALTKAGIFVWIGSNGHARVSATERKTDSRGMLDRTRHAYIKRGQEALQPAPKAPPPAPTVDFF